MDLRLIGMSVLKGIGLLAIVLIISILYGLLLNFYPQYGLYLFIGGVIILLGTFAKLFYDHAKEKDNGSS